MQFFRLFVLGVLSFFLLAPMKPAYGEETTFPISFHIELLPWEEVQQIIKRKTKFQVIDIETGLTFQVQRRAGSKHADVQPMSSKDTKMMKKIYNGKWSWKRRAILVLINDRLIAASMHGMPHGAGALINGFPGHFCIHFKGSSTHGSASKDLGHRLMILKAAGKLDEYLSTRDVYEMTDIFLTALNQDDISLLEKVVVPTSEWDEDNLQRWMEKTEGIMRSNEFEKTETDGKLAQEIPLSIKFYKTGAGKEKLVMKLVFVRHSIFDGWKVAFEPDVFSAEE